MFKYLACIAAIASGTLVANSTISAKTGGQLFRQPQYNYYLDMKEATEISFENALVANNATVEIEVGQSVRIMEAEEKMLDSSWYEPKKIKMTAAGDHRWTTSIKTDRHGLGSPKKVHGLNFQFLVTYPGEKTITLTCEGNADKINHLNFEDASKLEFAKAGESVVLKKATVDCVWKK